MSEYQNPDKFQHLSDTDRDEVFWLLFVAHEGMCIKKERNWTLAEWKTFLGPDANPIDKAMAELVQQGIMKQEGERYSANTSKQELHSLMCVLNPDYKRKVQETAKRAAKFVLKYGI